VGSRPRHLRPIAVLAALLGLAACTAGVPKTGEVVSLSPVTASTTPLDPAAPQARDTPSSGQSRTEVAVGFMNAMNTGSVSKMRRWVMPEARDQVASWSDPTTTVRVYSVFEPGPEYPRGQKRIVPIRVKLVGQLRGGREWFPANGEDVLSLEMENDREDARVANPGPVIWMRDASFSRLYSPAEVFMAPDLADPTPQLAPVPIFVPNGPEDDPAPPALRAEQVLRLLLEGPQRRYDHLDTAIPRGTALRKVWYAGDVATVNLSQRFSLAEGPGQIRVGQVVWTLNSVLPAASVRILVEGRPVKTVGGDRFSTTRPWRRWDPPLAGMWPRRSQGGEIVFVRRGEIWKIAPEPGQLPKAVTLVAPSPKSAPTWSPDHRSMAFLTSSGTRQGLWVLQPNGQDFRVDELEVGHLLGKVVAGGQRAASHIFGHAAPFVHRAVQLRLRPSAWEPELRRGLIDLARLGLDLPGALRRLTRQLERGEFTVSVRPVIATVRNIWLSRATMSSSLRGLYAVLLQVIQVERP
jgi:hypothetical protein